MKKNYPFLLLLLLTGMFSLHAQESITFKEGPQLPRGVASGGNSPFAEDANSFYIMHANKVGKAVIWVEKFDKKTLNNDYSVMIELMEGKDYFNLATDNYKLGVLDGEVILLYDVCNKDSNKRTLYRKTIGKTGAVSGRMEIASTDCPRSELVSEYSCIFSKDRSKAIIWLKAMKAGGVTPSLTFYDCNAQKNVWTKDAPTGYNGTAVNYDIDSVGNDGTSYISFSTGSSATNNVQKYKGTIKSGSSEFSGITENKWYEHDDTATKYFFTGSDLQLGKDTVVRGGLYCEKVADYDRKHPQELKIGAYLCFADPATKKISQEKYGLLSDDIHKKLTYKIKNADGQSLYPSDKSLNAERVIAMDGNYYLICEHSYTSVIISGGNQFYTPVNRELIICKFTGKGTFEWSRIIRKYSDYDLIACNGKLHFFYLESKKNEKDDVSNYTADDDYSKAELKESNTVCTTLDASGNLAKQVILRPEKDQYYYSPGWADMHPAPNQLTVHYQYGVSETSDAKFGTITIR